jgi:hypothetical protein
LKAITRDAPVASEFRYEMKFFQFDHFTARAFHVECGQRIGISMGKGVLDDSLESDRILFRVG